MVQKYEMLFLPTQVYNCQVSHKYLLNMPDFTTIGIFLKAEVIPTYMYIHVSKSTEP